VTGIVGIGGGVYLVPLIILLGLGTTKEAAASGAFFIWANSIAGLAARLQHQHIDFIDFTPLMLGVVIGGLAGSLLGANRFNPQTMQKVLGGILVIAIVFLGQKVAVA
jgi:uncharacterized membrane protein YfcA